MTDEKPISSCMQQPRIYRWSVDAGSLVPSEMHLHQVDHLKGKLNERIDLIVRLAARHMLTS